MNLLSVKHYIKTCFFFISFDCCYHHVRQIIKQLIFSFCLPRSRNSSKCFHVLTHLIITLTGVAQWVEHGPANERVAFLTPNLGYAHAWVLHQVPCRGCTRGNRTLMFLSLSPPPSLKINKIYKK